jgi:hypothetical protein
MKRKYPELAGLSKSEQKFRRNAINRARNIAAGLRSDGKKRMGRKPCGCLAGSCLKCARKGSRRVLMAELVLKMHADYMTGMTANAVGRKYPQTNGKPRSHGDMQQLFARRGLWVRPWKKIPRQANGSPVRAVVPPEKEIDAMIAGLDRLMVPAGLKYVWKRLWDFAQRRAFVKKLRLKFPSTRPTWPFSKNVEPFEYGSPRAMAIVARLNVGRNSRTKVAAMKPGSEGVIFENQLFYWIKNKDGSGDGYQCGGKPQCRVFLHHLLWEEHSRPQGAAADDRDPCRRQQK